MNKIGLVDFWFYHNEEFYFDHGHMLLRGSNGSGKSVTMQSFIPLLLDGNKSSERLDPFGTRSRKLEDYLLKETSTREERIGYLYLEFKRENVELYTTIGIGLKARRNKPLDAWYFVIEDNRRINQDIFLMQHDLAIAKQTLKNCINEQLIDNQGEYLKRVNKAIFGFEVNDYKDTINLLLQLRTPKLSNSLKPTKINEILSNSLQTLSTEDLRPMSEAITNMDNIKDQLESLKLSVQAAKNINTIYTQYNEYQLHKKAKEYTNTLHNKEMMHKEIKELDTFIANATTQWEEYKEQLVSLKIEEENLKYEKSTLASSDMERLEEELIKFTQTLQQAQKAIIQKKEILEIKENRCIDIKKETNESKNKKDQLEYTLEKRIKELDSYQEDLHFSEHLSLKQELFNDLDKAYDFAYTFKIINQNLALTNKGSSLLQEQASLTVQYDSYNNEKQLLVDDLEKQQVFCQKLEDAYFKALEEIKVALYSWNANNRLLVLNETELNTASLVLTQYLTTHDRTKFDTMILAKQRVTLQKLDQEENTQKALEKALKEELYVLDNELVQLENRKEPVFNRRESVVNNRLFLEKNKIAYKPLYQMLEFEDISDEAKKNHLEEMLLVTGLLDAIVVNKADRQQVLSYRQGQNDSYIFVEDVTSIETYILNIDSDFTDFTNFLKVLGCSQEDVICTLDGYQNGIVEGTISGTYQSIYLGSKARKKYQEECILKTRELIKEKELSLQEVVEKIAHLKNEEQVLEQEFQMLPSFIKLDEGIKAMLESDTKMESLNRHLLSVEELVGQIKSKLVKINKEIQEVALQLNINGTKEAFVILQEGYLGYQECLQDFRMEHGEYLNSSILFSNYRMQLEQMQEDVDVIHGELYQLQQDEKSLSIDISNVEKKLDNMGHQEIRKRVEEINTRLLKIPLIKEEQVKQVANLEKDISLSLQSKEEKKQVLLIEEENLSFYQKAFNDEIALGYKEIGNEFASALKKANQYIVTNSHLHDDLQGTFYRNTMSLQEYNLTIHSILDYQDERLSPRLDVSAKYKGKRVSFNQLLSYLQEDIELQELLLNQQDRDLFEDILVGNISKKIRLHIQNSRVWVENINQYIDDMNTSSGLKLKLVWKSVKAQNEQELDSSKLVTLLQKDAAILDKGDLDKISKHFRSKIQTARKQASREDNMQSFHQLMKEVMDYRNWFTFTIMYQKPGDNEKELTNAAFYAFSGGEKAMTMYIPLFSAVAAKFASASKDAPCIIALDEAFAGVDERNIENMFALINTFGFDYIMNSQILWGDYATVPHLAIYELFRPENARFVTVITYKWNGQVKEMIV